VLPRRFRSSPGPGAGDRFLGYEREELDRQYDLLTRHADSLPVFEGLYRTLSLQAHRRPGAALDVAYGDDEAMVMDLHPAGREGAPLFVVFQGRYWRTDERRDASYPALGLQARGGALAVVGLGAVPAVTLSAMIDRACLAVLWLRNNAARLHADPERIVLLGLGSGSHVATMTLTADWPRLAGEEAATCPVAAVAALSGIYDLEPVRLSFLNLGLELDAAAVAQLSPLRLVPALPRPAPRVLLAVGERETDEYHRHMASYGAALERHGVQVEAATIPGHHHFSLAAELANPESAITNRVIGLTEDAARPDIDTI
jgi:arylformamidase